MTLFVFVQERGSYDMAKRAKAEKPAGRGDNGGSVVGAQLRTFIERIEHLEEEKRAIAEDIKEVYAEAKGNGFDTKTIRTIVKLRSLSAEERAEQEALLDLYKAALGMLADTPLGEAALRRLSEKPAVAKQPGPEEPAKPEEPAPAEPQMAPELSIADAKGMGTEAARNGKPVTSNPFPARDPRRAAWDEAWCAGAGSDGMEIPAAWRRKPKKKPDDKPDARP